MAWNCFAMVCDHGGRPGAALDPDTPETFWPPEGGGVVGSPQTWLLGPDPPGGEVSFAEHIVVVCDTSDFIFQFRIDVSAGCAVVDYEESNEDAEELKSHRSAVDPCVHMYTYSCVTELPMLSHQSCFSLSYLK